MKVLQVLGRSSGGVATHVRQIAADLPAERFTVEIAAPAEVADRFPEPILVVEVPNGLRGHRAATARIRTLIRERGIDVVHGHGLRAANDALLARSVPTVATLHNLALPEIVGRIKARLATTIERRVVCGAEHTFVVSRDMRDHLARVAPGCSARVEVLQAAIATAPKTMRTREEIRSELRLGSDRPLIASVTRLAPQKEVDVLLRAVALLPGVDLVIVGDGPLEDDLRALTSELDLQDRVHFTGFRSDAIDLTASADVFCLSSRWEAVALAAQEAVLLGVPVVATAVGGLPELISDGRSGRLVPPGDPVALAAALKEVLTSPEIAATYAAAALSHVSGALSSANLITRLAQVYEQLHERAHRA